MNVAGSMSGCDKTFPFTTTFAGARTSSEPQAISMARDDRGGSDTVAAAIAAQAGLF
ncbi:hypothetical protein [Anaeromyxobacter sp. Fw109-5]|uniref:hypothetical protein n=1 Tax=Anaeromyxobacter sp. (strain Fw109-5) TaxID=404589 RepID=UPI000158A4BF|nr:hypothetical protein [Anaeromyxobacter sp. Fw109-5]ABS27026.1 hypothetical protein Anae109_2826 [Anaeromyxobacter sp. Fw109-5]